MLSAPTDARSPYKIPFTAAVGGAVLLLLFDRLLLHLNTALSSTDVGMLAFRQVWWASVRLRQADGIALNIWDAGPFPSNDVGYLPLLSGQAFALLRVFSGPLTAFNLLLLMWAAASLWLVILFLRAKGVPPVLAWLGAAAYLLSGWYAQVVTQGDVILAGLGLLPAALLAWDAWLESPVGWRGTLLIGVMYAAVLCGVQHIAWIICLWLPYAAFTWLRTSTDERAARRSALLTLAAIYLVLLLIYPLPVIVRTLQGSEPALASAADLLLPAGRRSLLGTLLRTGPLIWSVAGLALMLGAKRRTAEARFWAASAAACLIFGFGLLPEPLRMFSSALGLPYQPLYGREIFFGMGLFAALAGALPTLAPNWAALEGWVRAATGCGAAALMLITSPDVLRAYPLQAISIDGIYTQIASQPEDFYVLDYPFGVVSLQDGAALGSHPGLSIYAAWHGKRTVSGLGWYYAPAHLERLAAYDFLQAPGQPAAADQLAEAISTWRIGYVLVHHDPLSEAERDQAAQMLEASEALCPPQHTDRLSVYQARWHPGGCDAQP